MKTFRIAQILFCLLCAFTTLAASNPVSPTTPPNNTNWLTRFNPAKATMVLELGGFSAYQGKAQNMYIENLIGDRFTVTQHSNQNVLVGLGYFIDGYTHNRWRLLYGINAFFLDHTQVAGNVIQEDLFTNLSYSYSITNYPVYLAAKAFYNIPRMDRADLVLDLGIGPNFIKTGDFNETSLDGGITIPDYACNGQTNTAFSATAGIGVRFNKVLGQLPLELSYRFFYLGQGKLKSVNSQLLSNLNTGNSYANALVLSIYF